MYDEFTYFVAIAQLVCGIVCMPLVLNMSMKYENFDGTYLK